MRSEPAAAAYMSAVAPRPGLLQFTSQPSPLLLLPLLPPLLPPLPPPLPLQSPRGDASGWKGAIAELLLLSPPRLTGTAAPLGGCSALPLRFPPPRLKSWLWALAAATAAAAAAWSRMCLANEWEHAG